MTSPSLIRFPAPRHTTANVSAKKAAEFQSLAQLIEDLIPNFKKEEEKQFYREVVESYRAVARDILLKALSRYRPRHRRIRGHAGRDPCDCHWDDPAGWLQRQHRLLASCQFDSVISACLLARRYNERLWSKDVCISTSKVRGRLKGHGGRSGGRSGTLRSEQIAHPTQDSIKCSARPNI